MRVKSGYSHLAHNLDNGNQCQTGSAFIRWVLLVLIYYRYFELRMRGGGTTVQMSAFNFELTGFRLQVLQCFLKKIH